jgi:hypothetical protein
MFSHPFSNPAGLIPHRWIPHTLFMSLCQYVIFVLFKAKHKKPSVIPVRRQQCSRTATLASPGQSNTLIHNSAAKISLFPKAGDAGTLSPFSRLTIACVRITLAP